MVAPTRRQMRRDTAANLALVTPAEGEPGYDITNKRMIVGDGAMAGGVPHASYRDVQNNSFIGAVAAGTANDLTISTVKNPSTLANLQSVRVKITATNTGAATLQWGSIPANAIKKYMGTGKVDLVAGDLISGKIYHFDFDGTDWVLFAGGGDSTPAGNISDTARLTAPNGWLMCYGQAVSRTTYAELFDAIGTTYGSGDGLTTFNLPDLRGRISAGKDDMGGTSANRLTGLTGGLNGDVLGASGGAEAVTLSTGEMPSHDHALRDYIGGSTAGRLIQKGSSGTTSPSNNSLPTTSSTGGGGAHNNVQPTFILNKIIKT